MCRIKHLEVTADAYRSEPAQRSRSMSPCSKGHDVARFGFIDHVCVLRRVGEMRPRRQLCEWRISGNGREATRFESCRPDFIVNTNPDVGCESDWRRDLNFSESISFSVKSCIRVSSHLSNAQKLHVSQCDVQCTDVNKS